MTNELNSLIRDHAMLVTYTTTTWTASHNDRSLARKIEKETNSTSGSMKLSKNLMAGHDKKLDTVRSVLNEARASHSALTLPWGNSRMRMMPVLNFERYTETMAKHQHQFQTALDAACATYATDAQAARDGLGIPVEYHQMLYPTTENMKAMWSFKLHFEPIAEGAAFPGLPEDVTKALAGRFETKVQCNLDTAINEHLREMQGLCDALLENLKKDKPTFRDAGVFNIVDGALGLKRFNVQQDHDVDEVAREINQILSHWDVKDLKSVRKDGASSGSYEVLRDEITLCHVKLGLALKDRGYSE